MKSNPSTILRVTLQARAPQHIEGVTLQTPLNKKNFHSLPPFSTGAKLWNISGNMSLVSEGRINWDTPPLTTLSHTSKSSAMDISSHIFQIVIRKGGPKRFRNGPDLRLV